MEEKKELELYTSYRLNEDGTQEAVGYAYGEEWIAMALYMGDISFDTPEEAMAWWEKNYGEGKKK